MKREKRNGRKLFPELFWETAGKRQGQGAMMEQMAVQIEEKVPVFPWWNTCCPWTETWYL